jgi:hypothetical protein
MVYNNTMNIFVLHPDPEKSARDHCDKHVVKMILEYGQMLSTAHRLLDGMLLIAADEYQRQKPKKMWLFHGEVPVITERQDENGAHYRWEVQNAKCYQVAHANHPCSIWARETSGNYNWLFRLFNGCLREYTQRYGKKHSAERIANFVSQTPINIKQAERSQFALAMPEEYKHEDAVEAYRRFYAGSKVRFAKWKYTSTPEWFKHRVEGQNAASFSRAS